MLPRQRFVRDVATLSGATALAQVIALVALPILTRLYTPQAYGIAAAFAGIVGLVGVVGALRYELAIPLPRTDRGAWHLAILALMVLAGVVFVAGGIAPWLGGQMADDIEMPVWAFAVLLATSIATLGAYQVANYWAVRKSNFGTIARTRIQQGVVGPAGQLALGLAGLGPLGLIVGQILGQCAGLTHLATRMFADNRRTGLSIHPRGIGWAMKRYRRFPLYDSWAGLLNVAGGQAPILLFAALFSPAFAGYYALSHRVLSAPLGLVGKSVSQVLMPRIVAAGRTGEAGQLLKKLIRLLAMVSLPPFAMVAVVAPDIVPTLFGSEWAPAGWVVSWTAVWVGWQFICSPLSVVLIALEAQKLNTVLQALLLALRIAALLIGAVLGSANIALVAFSLASAVGYAGYTMSTGIAVGLSVRDMARAVWQPAVFAGISFGIVAVISQELSGVRYCALALLAGLWVWRLWTMSALILKRHGRTAHTTSK
jgi:lipopolysaccharide exporter